MTTAIVFSKDRACQLDLLLRSIEQNAPGLYSRVHIIWKADGEYAAAYRVCAGEHEWAEFSREENLRSQTLWRAEKADPYLGFLMDDCIFYRPLGYGTPGELLDDEDVLCFSPRLGLNTTDCYPLRQPQPPPEFVWRGDGELIWDWTAGAECDWSYPASLDGHVFRQQDLLPLLRVVHDWRTPNTLEAALSVLVQHVNRPLMGCHQQSSLVGVPVNRVGSTHEGNRFGETHPHDVLELNRRYLAGDRLGLNIDSAVVNAAHVEFPLRLVAATVTKRGA